MKFKRMLSLALALIFAFSAVTVVASATSVVDEASITFDFDIAGIDADNYEEYITINTAGLEFEDNYGDPAVYVEDSSGEDFTGTFEDGETYSFYIYLSALDGYELGEIDTATVNGQELYAYISWWSPDEVEVYYVAIEFDAVIGENGGFGEDFYEGAKVTEVSIDVDIEAGTKVGDWTDYVIINTDGVTYDDDNQYPGVYVYCDGESVENYEYFKAGKTYEVYIELTPAEGYWFGYNFNSVTVNGEEVSDYYIDTYYNEADEEVQYAEIYLEIDVEGEEELSVFQRIINFFIGIFESIIDLFTPEIVL